MTDEQKAAMEWLDGIASGNFTPAPWHEYAATLKAMLAEREAMRATVIAECSQAVGTAAWCHQGGDAYSQGMDAGARHQVKACLDALAALTKPATKEVEVWHVEFSAKRNGKWVPFVNGCSTESGAQLRASELRNSPLGGNLEPEGYRCIRVTGPHKQTVPA